MEESSGGMSYEERLQDKLKYYEFMKIMYIILFGFISGMMIRCPALTSPLAICDGGAIMAFIYYGSLRKGIKNELKFIKQNTQTIIGDEVDFNEADEYENELDLSLDKDSKLTNECVTKLTDNGILDNHFEFDNRGYLMQDDEFGIYENTIKPKTKTRSNNKK